MLTISYLRKKMTNEIFVIEALLSSLLFFFFVCVDNYWSRGLIIEAYGKLGMTVRISNVITDNYMTILKVIPISTCKCSMDNPQY